MSYEYRIIHTKDFDKGHDHIVYNRYLSEAEFDEADYDTCYYKPTIQELLNSYAIRGFSIDRIEYPPESTGDTIVIFLKAQLPLRPYDIDQDPLYEHFRQLQAQPKAEQ